MLKHETEVFAQPEPKGDAEYERSIMQRLKMCQNIPDMMNLTPCRKIHMLIFIRWTGSRFAQHPHTHAFSPTFWESHHNVQISPEQHIFRCLLHWETLNRFTAATLKFSGWNTPERHRLAPQLMHITKLKIHTDNAGSKKATQSYLWREETWKERPAWRFEDCQQKNFLESCHFLAKQEVAPNQPLNQNFSNYTPQTFNSNHLCLHWLKTHILTVISWLEISFQRRYVTSHWVICSQCG